MATVENDPEAPALHPNIRKLFTSSRRRSDSTASSSSITTTTSIAATVDVVENEPQPTQRQIDLVRYSWERVSELRHPDDDDAISPSHAFGLAFYDALFELNSDLRAFFNNIVQQARALTWMISYIARAPAVTSAASSSRTSSSVVQQPRTIRELNAINRARQVKRSSGTEQGREEEEEEEGNPEWLAQKLQDLGARHIAYGVRPEHLGLVGPAFVMALKKRLLDEYDPEIGDAWLAVCIPKLLSLVTCRTLYILTVTVTVTIGSRIRCIPYEAWSRVSGGIRTQKQIPSSSA